MRYILMMNTSRGSGGYEISGWSPEEFEAHMAHMYRLNQELTEAGELIAVEALAAPGQAKLVCVGGPGRLVWPRAARPRRKARH